MKYNVPSDKIVDLLVRSITEEISQEESAGLEQWLDGDKAHREMYARLLDTGHIAGQYRIWSRTRGTDREWAQMEERMERSRTMRRRRAVVRRLAPYFSAAALVVAGLFIYRAVERTSADSASVIAVQNIMLGKNTAVIEMETGQIVPLDGTRKTVSGYLPAAGRMIGDSIVDYRTSREVPYTLSGERHNHNRPRGG